MSTQDHAGLAGALVPHASRSCQALCTGSTVTAEVPRAVTTGRKSNEVHPSQALNGIDEETGEPIEVHTTRNGFKVIHHLVAEDTAPPDCALVDALAFTVVPPEAELGVQWVIGEMRRFLPLGAVKHRSCGGAGFKHSADLGDGLGLWSPA